MQLVAPSPALAPHDDQQMTQGREAAQGAKCSVGHFTFQASRSPLCFQPAAPAASCQVLQKRQQEPAW